ncbi:class I poly(R)-hydroxyalkanoic acid synthase [Actibacterium sp. MT2.3-13A]|uniref:class I poly(R)-hydroxyalkanoic acid synthase n=1 Tax=Actibacterium sp. MT2.3-13A TaxID=2828332 RepID=UPI001BA8209D|nr:class I poly(R)-hydroxyalkanoic acid synthase [Actibacterium sp. MT2.3-13A]
MTSDDGKAEAQLERMNENLARVEALSERLVNALSKKRQIDPNLQGPGQDLFMKAASAYMAEFLQHPSKIFEHQISFWGKTLQHFIAAQEALASGTLAAPEDNTPPDPRFSNPLWQTHPYFNFVKQQYLLSAEAVENAVRNIEGLEPKDRKRLEYFSRQIVDMMSPANFLATNPDALVRAVETEGESLVRGLENLVRDIEANDGELLVTLADKNAFRVGENLATSPGEVVFRNRMLELIQYAPTTEKVHATPLIIFPPWINKFYILDLKEKNSLVKWITDQGFTLFVVSWVNPDASYADVGMDDYVQDGYLAAIEQVKQITGEDKVNAVGYCIAGTTLALTLALLHRRGDKSVRSATFFTTMTDFSDQGEFSVFLGDDFVDGIEREAQAQGYLDSFFMSRTFSFLRSNDLIYGPAIRSYMMGEAPPAFDLLYWNGDSTNLPGRMAVEYLRGLCQRNEFAADGYEILGEKVRIGDVRVPLCAVACETDHIAAWRASFDGLRKMGSRDKTFILSESGHIAGIVNPPSKRKYGHYTNDGPMEEADAWLEGATFHEGSWWPRWGEWLRRRSGRRVPARRPGDSTHPPLAKAPGTYVLPGDPIDKDG